MVNASCKGNSTVTKAAAMLVACYYVQARLQAALLLSMQGECQMAVG